MELQFATRMKDYEEGIFQVLNEKKEALLAQGGRCTICPWVRRIFLPLRK